MYDNDDFLIPFYYMALLAVHFVFIWERIEKKDLKTYIYASQQQFFSVKLMSESERCSFFFREKVFMYAILYKGKTILF